MPDLVHPIDVIHVPRKMPLAAMPVPAGFPSPAGDDLEDGIDPVAWVVRNERSTFWWRIEGDSLEGAGIFDGDLVAVDRTGRRRKGRIAVAVVDGAITIKRLAQRDDQWFLEPCARREGYKSIPVTETTEIWGMVAGVVRRLPIE